MRTGWTEEAALIYLFIYLHTGLFLSISCYPFHNVSVTFAVADVVGLFVLNAYTRKNHRVLAAVFKVSGQIFINLNGSDPTSEFFMSSDFIYFIVSSQF